MQNALKKIKATVAQIQKIEDLCNQTAENNWEKDFDTSSRLEGVAYHLKQAIDIIEEL